MKGTSRVIMGATLAMVVALAIVLGLVMVLLAELYCSLLLRRRKELQSRTSGADNSSQPPQNQSATPPLGSFYAQGVLHAPRNLLFPALSSKDEAVDIEKQNAQPPNIQESKTQKTISTAHHFKIVHAPPPSPIQGGDGGGATTSGDGKENLVYISNPMYDNDGSEPSKVDTPYGTPDSSPSRLETSGSSSGEDDDDMTFVLPLTPPLSPMKKLPAEACSVSLRDARSLGVSCGDSNSINGGISSSSSSSGSPSTTPSW